MFPYDSRDHSHKRKFIEVGNTSTDPFGLNVDVDAFHGRAPNTTLYPTDNIKYILDRHHRPIKSFTSLLLDGNIGDDDDGYFDEDDVQKDENLEGFRKKLKGQVMPFDPLTESDHKKELDTLKNQTYGSWSLAMSKAAEMMEEKDAEMQKLSRDIYEKTKQLVSCRLKNMVLKKKSKMAVNKVKSLRKTLKEVLSRPAEGQEDEGESSFVGTKRDEAAWLCCKVCDARMANMIICPCKHMSVCRRCDDTITKCPICKAAKISSVEVCLP